MKDVELILRVAHRYLQADQPPGMRKKVKDLVKPVNRLKGIEPAAVKEHGELLDSGTEEIIDPNRRDIRPKDVFIPKPDQISVRSLADTGKDLSKVIKNQIPRDKGYDTVKNLSQYLIETMGGGGTFPVK
jgi:hypothetical protein